MDPTISFADLSVIRDIWPGKIVIKGVQNVEDSRRLVDAALDAGGSFYLPYRLHAQRGQVGRAYPRVEEFVSRKRHYDPGLLFQNTMWKQYLATT